MEFEIGDWVQTDSGQKGKILLISRLSAFVEIGEGTNCQTICCLISQLTRLDTPEQIDGISEVNPD